MRLTKVIFSDCTLIYVSGNLILRLEIIKPLCQKPTDGTRLMKMAVIHLNVPKLYAYFNQQGHIILLCNT